MCDTKLTEYLGSLSYRRIGGISNEVYLHEGRGEILKLGTSAEPAERNDRTAGFEVYREVSRLYAPLGLMPEVFETGSNFAGTGYPYLREQYIPGQSLTDAYLENPALWTRVLPDELSRIYQTVVAAEAQDVRASWEDKVHGIPEPPGTDEIYRHVRAAGERLAASYPRGYRIHGDLQFGNMLAVQDSGESRIMLIDWEVSEVMSLGYEFAMLYTFLLDPVGQVEPNAQAAYRRLRPLRDVWNALSPVLSRDLGITKDEFESSVIFRMGTGWLALLEGDLRSGRVKAAQKRHQALDALTGRCYFSVLPYPQ